MLRKEAEAKAKTSVWWDMDSRPIPSGYDAGRIREGMERALEKIGCSGPMTMITCSGNLKETPEHVLRALSSTKIILIHSSNGEGDSLKYIIWFNNIQQSVCYEDFSRTVGEDHDLGPQCRTVLDSIHSHGRCTLEDLTDGNSKSKDSTTECLQKLINAHLIECCMPSQEHHVIKQEDVVDIHKESPEFVEDFVLQTTTQADPVRFPSQINKQPGANYRINYEGFISRLRQSYFEEHGVVDPKAFDSFATQAFEIKKRATIKARFGDEHFKVFTDLSEKGASVFVEAHELVDATITVEEPSAIVDPIVAMNAASVKNNKVKKIENCLEYLWKNGFVDVQKTVIAGVDLPVLSWTAHTQILKRRILDDMYREVLDLSILIREKKPKIPERKPTKKQQAKQDKAAKRLASKVRKGKKSDKEEENKTMIQSLYEKRYGVFLEICIFN